MDLETRQRLSVMLKKIGRDPNRSESLLCANDNRRLCFYFTYALWKGADGTTRFGHDDSSAKSKKRNVPIHVQTYGKEKKTNEQNPSKKERKIQFRKREVTQKEHYLFLFLQSQNLLHWTRYHE